MPYEYNEYGLLLLAEDELIIEELFQLYLLFNKYFFF